MHSGARVMPASWIRSAIPGVLPTRCRRRRDRHYNTSSPRTRATHTARPLVLLIPPRGIDDVLQCAAGLKAFDLARDVFRYFIGIGIGGVVWRQHDLWMRPERALRRQRFVCEDIQRRGAERAVVKASEDVSFVLQPASPGIDQNRRAKRAIPVEFCKQSPVQDVPRIGREWQQADQDIGALEKCIELRVAVKAVDTINLPWTAAPARHAKAETPEHFGRVRPERAKAHDADRYCARRPLKFWLPPLLALAGSQIKLLPMMHQHVKHHVFRHS